MNQATSATGTRSPARAALGGHSRAVRRAGETADQANQTLQRAKEQIKRAEAAYPSAEAALAEIDRKECATLQKQFATGAWPAPPPSDDQRKDRVDVFLNRAAVEALRSIVQVPGNPFGRDIGD